MDSHGKGRQKERDVMDEWMAAGWECWQPPRGRYGKQDIFGVGDFIAIYAPTIYIVQVCHVKSRKRHRAAIDAWNAKHGDVLPCILVTYK